MIQPTFTAGQTVSVRDVLDLPQPQADHRIAYGPAPLQFGDLYLPTGDGPFPVVVFIHGGCWRSEYTISHTASLSNSLREAGLAVWSLEYRKSGDPGGVWPNTYLDIAQGIDFVEMLVENRQFPLDLNRVVVAGHSAGAYMALWAVSRHRIPRSSVLFSPHPLKVRAAVALAGAGNMITLFEDGVCAPAVEDILGGTPDEHPSRYTESSPEFRLPLGERQILIIGEKDPIVPMKYVTSYFQKASGEDPVEMIVLPGAGHFEMIVPGTSEFSRVRDIITELLKY